MTFPKNWEKTKMGDIGRYLNGKAFKSEEWKSTGRPIIRIQNLTGSGSEYNYFQGEAEDRYVVMPGDLLFSWSATLGTYIWQGPEAVLNQHIFKVESYIDKKFHRYLLDFKIQEMQSQTHGSGMVHITKKSFDAIEVHIPPIDEQHKIVELLEDHLSRLDAALIDLKKARDMCSSLLAASLKSIVESVPHSYRPLSEVVQKIEAGKSFNCLGRPAEKEEWGVIKVSAMTWGEFLPKENKAAPLEYNPPLHHKISVGDILISRANTQKYVGAAVRVKKAPGKLLLSDKSLRIIPKSDYDASWLLAALSSPITREEISKRATGNEDSMRNISQKNLLEVQIPVPIDQDGQLEVVESLSFVETGIASNLQIIEQTLLRMIQFRRSLLNKAFTAQLTSEVASV